MIVGQRQIVQCFSHIHTVYGETPEGVAAGRLHTHVVGELTHGGQQLLHALAITHQLRRVLCKYSTLAIHSVH